MKSRLTKHTVRRNLAKINMMTSISSASCWFVLVQWQHSGISVNGTIRNAITATILSGKLLLLTRLLLHCLQAHHWSKWAVNTNISACHYHSCQIPFFHAWCGWRNVAARQHVKLCWNILNCRECAHGVVSRPQVSLTSVFELVLRLMRSRDCKLQQNRQKSDLNAGECWISLKDCFISSAEVLLTCRETCKATMFFAVTTVPRDCQCCIHAWQSLVLCHRWVTQCSLRLHERWKFPAASPMVVFWINKRDTLSTPEHRTRSREATCRRRAVQLTPATADAHTQQRSVRWIT